MIEIYEAALIVELNETKHTILNQRIGNSKVLWHKEREGGAAAK